jgi:serine protease Do
MKKIKLLLFTILFFLSAAGLHAQQADRHKLEASLNAAIAKAYPACVRIWGFDAELKQQTSAQFSGVVVSSEGHILTVAHTTVPGKTYLVTFPDGKQCMAIALGKIVYPESPNLPDVAMMKITDKGDWPWVQMARSSALKQFDPCLSMSYPESLAQKTPSIRFGYISNIRTEQGMLQSTCKMEPGDSGGPLFDHMGRLIGLHSAIDVPEDINFDVPVDLYRRYWSALNIETNYSSLPGLKDSVENDPFEKDLSAYAKLQRLAEFAVKGKRNDGCVKVMSNMNGARQEVLGTHIALATAKYKSIIISKSSLIGTGPTVILSNKQEVKATVIARDVENDLVMLAIPAAKGGLEFSRLDVDTVRFATMGKFLLSPIPVGKGTTSILGTCQFSVPRISSVAYLGIVMGAKTKPFLLARLKAGSPASIADLLAGDEVLSIGDEAIARAADFSAALRKHWPGDTLVFSIMRAGAMLNKKVILGYMPQRPSDHPAEQFLGGKSARRDGFKSVVSHDAVLLPKECGGPVMDFDGIFYGINIARFSRTSSLMVPAVVIKEFIVRNLQ